MKTQKDHKGTRYFNNPATTHASGQYSTNQTKDENDKFEQKAKKKNKKAR